MLKKQHIRYVAALVVGGVLFFLTVFLFDDDSVIEARNAHTFRTGGPSSNKANMVVDKNDRGVAQQDQDAVLVRSLKDGIQEMQALINSPPSGLPQDIEEIEEDDAKVKALIAEVEKEIQKNNAGSPASFVLNEMDHPEQYKRQQDFSRVEEEMNEIARNIR